MGWKKNLPREGFAADQYPCAFLDCIGDQLLHLGQLPGVGQRSDLSLWIHAVADYQGFGRRDKTIDKRLINITLDEESGRRDADLARPAKAVRDTFDRCLFDVCVCKYQHRAMAAQFKGDGFDALGGASRQQPPDGHRTGECHLANDR